MTESSKSPAEAPAPWERSPEEGALTADRLPELNASVHHMLQRTELWMWLLVAGLSIGGTIITLVVLEGWNRAEALPPQAAPRTPLILSCPPHGQEELPPQAAPPPRLWPVLLLGGASCLAGAVVLARCALALRAFCRNESPGELERMFRFQFHFWQVGVFGSLMLLVGTAMVIAVQVVVKLGL